tara:strand:- start:284 stop:463 length:180 start_codon:yes stop_codon:yes gene_type:complete
LAPQITVAYQPTRYPLSQDKDRRIASAVTGLQSKPLRAARRNGRAWRGIVLDLTELVFT